MRKIVIYSTKGGTGVIETEAKTWGEIESQVREIVGDLDNLIATENKNKTTLEHSDAVLPEEDFKIFLRPSKTKSGISTVNMSFKDLRKFVESQGQPCKAFLNLVAKDFGKNWTQLTTKELQYFLGEYKLTEEIEEDTDLESLKNEFDELEKGFC